MEALGMMIPCIEILGRRWGKTASADQAGSLDSGSQEMYINSMLELVCVADVPSARSLLIKPSANV